MAEQVATGDEAAHGPPDEPDPPKPPGKALVPAPRPESTPIPEEALEFLPDALMIEERPLPRSARLTLYALLAMVATAILWATVSEIDRVVSARGKLVTTPATIVVQPLETSVVRSIDVVVGQQVRKGQVLGALDPTFAQADVNQLRARFQAASAQVARLEAEMDGRIYQPADPTNPDEALQARLYRERMAQYQSRMRSFAETLARHQAALITNDRDQKVLHTRQQTLLEVERMRSQLLQSQNESRLKVLEAADRRLEVERDLQMAIHREAELQHELASAESERAAFAQEWQQKMLQELFEARRERDTAGEQLEKAAKRSELIALTSPSDAMVQEIGKKSVGSVIREAEPMFTLVPLDTPLEAEGRIEARDIANIRAGDPVRIKIDAFPFQKHGTIPGTVRAISQDAFVRENLPAHMADHGAEAYYVARIALGETNLRDVPEGTRLIPGMTLTGEIVVGQRGVLSYFLYPLIRVLDESIREP